MVADVVYIYICTHIYITSVCAACPERTVRDAKADL